MFHVTICFYFNLFTCISDTLCIFQRWYKKTKQIRLQFEFNV